MRLGRDHLGLVVFFLALALRTTGYGEFSLVDADTLAWRHAVEAGRAAQWVTYHSQQARQQPHRSEFAALAWQWRAYETQQMQWASYYRSLQQRVPVPSVNQAAVATPPAIALRSGCAYGHRSLPPFVHRLIAAGNTLQNKPYLLGGGHRKLDDVGYDCSSATSYVLIKAGLLDTVMNSSRMVHYGEPGPGRLVTVWVKPGQHVFITICGLRLDTSGGRVSEGPRWRKAGRSTDGFFPRHPRGL